MTHLVLALGLVFVSFLAAETRVAVYDAGQDGGEADAAANAVKLLSTLEGLQVEKIGELTSARLSDFSVVVLPAGLGGRASGQAGPGLRAFALTGGNVVLSIELAGGGYPPASTDPVFPEVFSFRGEIRLQKAVTRTFRPPGKHPIADGIGALKPSHHPEGWLKNNAVFFEPGPDAEVVLADEGLPYYGVIVAGEVGCGRLVAWGMLFPPAPADEPEVEKGAGEEVLPTPDTEAAADAEALRKLFLHSVLWASGGTSTSYAATVKAEWKRLRPAMDWERLDALAASVEQLQKESGGESVSAISDARALLAASRKLWEEKGGILERPASRRGAAELVETLWTDLAGYRPKALELALKLTEARRQLRLKKAKMPERSFPAYPRIICHLFSMVREGPSASIADRYLHEAAVELGANADASVIENHYNPGEWLVDEKLISEYLNLCEWNGLQFLGWSARPEGRKVRETRAAEIYAPYPAFTGFLIDEPFYLFGKGNYSMPYADAEDHFQAFLRGLPKDLLERAEADPDKAALAQFDHSKEIIDGTATPVQRVRWTLAGQFFRQELGGMMRRTFQAFKDADPRLLAWTNLNVYEWFSYGQSLLDFGEFSDLLGFDPYRSGDFSECFILDAVRAAARGPVIGIAFGGGEYTYFQEHYRRHLYNLAVHGDGIGLFTWSTLYKWQHGYSDERKAWGPGFWEMSCEVLQELRRLEPFLVRRESVAGTALLVSERTMWTRFYVPWGGRTPTVRYWNNLVGLDALLRQQLGPVDVLFAEQLGQKLKRYAVLVAPEALSLTDEEIQALRLWVEQGGVLIATAGTARCDPWGIERPAYPLEGLFAARPAGPAGEKPAVALPAGGTEWVYAGPEAVKIEIRGDAAALLHYADGSMAATARPAGRGLAILLGIPFLGLHDKEGSKMPAFAPAVPRILDLLLHAARGKARAIPAVRIESPGESGRWLTDLRCQKGEDRFVLCLLDYGQAYKLDTSVVKAVPFKSGVPARFFKPQPTGDVPISLTLPADAGGEKVRVWLPRSGQEVEAAMDNGGIRFTVPSFVLFELVAIEYEKQEARSKKQAEGDEATGE